MILGESQQFASPEEALAHFGIKGMKWGVRKERASNLKPLVTKTITRTTKNGDQFTVEPNPPTALHKALAFASASYAKNYQNSSYLSIKDKNGKEVGNGNFWVDKNDPKAMYLNWITVDKSARGHGYASEVLRAAEDHSRAKGMNKMKLEVPGNAPDARHIYEKQGFKVTKEADPKEAAKDPVWGGLTHMEKQL